MSGLHSGLSIGFLIVQTTVNLVPTPSLFDVALKNAFVGILTVLTNMKQSKPYIQRKSKGGEKKISTCQCN
jgi:hypothetical protein